MSYYFNKTLHGKSFEEVIEQVKVDLKAEGFGIITEIDMKDTLKKKIDVDYKKYTILGACNPGFAYRALQCEDKIGVLLPCNVVVQEQENGGVEVAAINPNETMSAVHNEALSSIAGEVTEKLWKVIDNLR